MSIDACYDRWRYHFASEINFQVKTGLLLKPKSSETGDVLFMVLVLYLPRPWGFPSGIIAFLFFVRDQIRVWVMNIVKKDLNLPK